jgi:hypothetical protein
MAQQELKEWQRPNSDFIKKYVAKHKQELEKLRAKAKELAFHGQWVIIGDQGYLKKSEQYAMSSCLDEHLEGEVSPRIILSPSAESEKKGEEDIKKAIRLCRELKMKIAVRTGGHQYCGFSSTLPVNMQIDVSKTFPQHEYNAETNVLRCGVSQPLGEWAVKNHAQGIYLPMGVCPSVHLGGHVHTGGWGMVARSHGLLADRVLAFDIILASGEKERIVRPEKGKTSPHNDDVYYAVLGGGKGGDFGIVTHLEFKPLRDRDHPNAECYKFVWIWTKAKAEAAVRKMAELSKLCADGTIPSDYEFVLNITGFGENLWVSQPVKEDLTRQGKTRIGNRALRLFDGVQDKLRERAIAGIRKRGLLRQRVQDKLREMGITSTEKMDSQPQVKEALKAKGYVPDPNQDPPAIQMWMCFTNKGGEGEQFDDQWFNSFIEVCGKPDSKTTKENASGQPNTGKTPEQEEQGGYNKKIPLSRGLSAYLLMRDKRPREMPYPFVKRFQVTMDLPEGYPKTFTDQMHEIMGDDVHDEDDSNWGTDLGQHLVSQQQIYAGGAVAENGKAGITSYSWREQTVALSYDSFYLVSPFDPDARKTAEDWQKENDEKFIKQKGFADKDMRMFAYTFGDRELEKVWQYYYDSEEKYNRLRKIKGRLDPDGLFSAGPFSLKPLY